MRNLVKKTFCVVILVICCCMLSSCYDSTEADEKNYAVIVGIDKGSERENIYTVLCPEFLPQGAQSSSGGDSGSSSPEGYAIYSVLADNMNHALAQISSTSSKTLSLSQVKAFILSSSLSDRETLTNVLEDIFRHEERTFASYVMMSEGTASEFLDSNTYSSDGNISNEIINQIKQASFNQTSVDVTFIDFYTNLMSNKTAYLPKCSLDSTALKSPVNGIINGVYLFDENNDFIPIEIEDTQNLLVATKTVTNLNYNKNGLDAVLSSYRSPKINSREVDGSVVTVIDIYLDGKMYSQNHDINDAKSIIIKDICEQTEKLYNNMCRQKGIDILGIKQLNQRHFLTVKSFEDFKSNQPLNDSYLKLNVHLSLRSAT